MDNLLGMKELYEVALKTTYPIEVGGKTLAEGEIIAYFDNIQVSGLSELKMRKGAHGGFDDRTLVTWDEVKEVNMTFSQGIFSKTHLALLGNSKLLEVQEGVPGIIVPKREDLESDANNQITLRYVPVLSTLFIYNKMTGEKLTYTQVSDKIFELPSSFMEVIVVYNFEYDGGATIIKVGRRLIEGYMRLEGKTRLKDDTTGHTVTGVITIPRLKLMSDLSMRLGSNASPTVASFSAVGYPVGVKGNKSVLDVILLNDDIDSDM